MKYIVLFVSFIFMISCANIDDKSNLILIDFDNLESFENKIDSVYFVPLENVDNVYIGSEPEIIFFGGKIFICNKSAKSIYIFSGQGNYLSTLSNRGDAPGEYGSIDDFFVNNNGIFVYDGIKHKLFNYLINGDYINSINVNVKAQHVIEYNNTYVFYGSNLEMDDSQVNVCDKNGYIINSLLIKDDCSLIDLPLYRPLSIVNDQLYLTTTFDYNIYTCSKENIEVKWKLDFANNSLNSSFKNENKKNLHIADVITSKSFRDKVLWVDAISGVDDWFLFTAVTGGGDHHLIFNEQNDIIYSLDQIGHPFDFFDSQLFSCKDFFVGVLQATNIMQLKNLKDGGLSLNKYCDELLKNKITEEDNPVLVFFKIKK